MAKKVLCALLIVFVAVPCLIPNASANGIMPLDLYTRSCRSTLTISGTTAKCESELKGYPDVTTKIVMTQILEKKSTGTTWTYVTSWSETFTDWQAFMTNYAYNLSSGTYRLRTVCTVYSGSAYENIEKSSSSVTI